MTKPALTLILLFSLSIVYSQQKTLILKKGNKTLDNFWKGSIIVFKLKDKSWLRGEIKKISKDSVYIKPIMIQYNFMKADTLYSPIIGFSLGDIYAFPKPGVRVDYIDGRFQMLISGSHVKWYWIKNGWIFRAGAIGYTGLNIINSTIQNDFSWSKNKMQLGAATAIFLTGLLLEKIYKPTLRLGKKYHVKVLDLFDGSGQ